MVAPKPTRIAVLMTCHNRREATLRCLAALAEAEHRSGFPLAVRVFLTDDGGTDGTAAAVATRFPNVTLLRGNGRLFWSGGMRLAFSAALEQGSDHYLWLNDDTTLSPDALAVLIGAHREVTNRGNVGGIVVGSTRDPRTETLTYGGVKRRRWWKRHEFGLVEPGSVPIECETMNGNCVLIPSIVAERVGNLASVFTHGINDYDYGLRARRLGLSVWIAPGYVGTCSRNSDTGTWRDASLPLRERWRKVRSPKGLPPREWAIFLRRHAGPLWFVFWIVTYVKLVLSSARVRSVSGTSE